MNIRGQMRRVLQGLALSLLLPFAASAATNYNFGNLTGANFDFIDLNETVQTADDESAPLFEAPGVLGGSGGSDVLVFTPSSFLADSAGGEGQVPPDGNPFDNTHSTFNATIMGNAPGAFVDNIILTENGDGSITSFGGIGGVTAQLSGTITILDTVSGANEGSSFNFGVSGDNWVTSYTGGSVIGDQLTISTPGAISWSAVVDIDLASVFGANDITKVELQWNNILSAFSQATSDALIQKKTGETTLQVIPEPTTGLLLLGGLIGLAARRRS
ncbi:MAG: PEP-CTERM sorting domain-containing protein [Myxococcota bacterium]